MDTKDRQCGLCVWWQDYSDRVYARISGAYDPIHPGKIELRRCRYIPNPRADSAGSVYTDEKFVCGAYEQKDIPF